MVTKTSLAAPPTSGVSGDTEGLTMSGWKAYGRIDEGEPLASVHPATGAFEFVIPTAVTATHFTGVLVHHRSRGMDHLATDNHQLLVRSASSVAGRDRAVWRWRPVTEVTTSSFVRTAAWSWAGTCTLPTAPAGSRSKAYTFNDATDLAQFVGWYVSEGVPEYGRVGLCQSATASPGFYAEICELVQRLGFTPARHPTMVRVNSVPLAAWAAEQFGHGSAQKRLPTWVKSWPTELLEELVVTMVKGDGHVHNAGRSVLTTTSDRLVDDVQEVAAKLGYTARAGRRYEGPCTLGGDYWGSARKVSILKTAEQRACRATAVEYSGMIWAPVMPTGTWLSRRNGKVIVTGDGGNVR